MKMFASVMAATGLGFASAAGAVDTRLVMQLFQAVQQFLDEDARPAP